MSFAGKMAVTGIIFVMPIALLIVLLHLQINGDKAFYEQERLGVAYTRALRPLFFDLEADRTADGDRAGRRGLGQRIDADFLAALRSDAGATRELKLTTGLLALQKEWHARGDSSAALRDLIKLLGFVSDNSKITLDPMLDGYYVGDTMVNKVPSLVDSVARVAVIGRRWLDTGALSANDRIALTILAGQVDIAREGIDHNLPIAIDAAPYLRVRLDRPRLRERDVSSVFGTWLKSNLLKSKLPNGSAAQLAFGRSVVLAESFALYDVSIGAMDEVLQTRINALVRREITIFALVFGAIAVAIGLMIVMTRSMSRHLADKIALEHEIVERTHVEKQLAFAAFHDELTGLCNRAFLMERLNDILTKPGGGEQAWAILFLDLDRFKVVNDSLGHKIGDSVLIEAARRFAGCVRSCDTLVRLGGDEFIILIDDIDDIEVACEVARRFLRTFDAPFAVGGRELYASASIGIAISESGNDRPEDILRNADIAMYRAKAMGKKRYEIFTPELLTSAVTRLEVDTDLARALERDEFRLFYQPIISLHDGRLSGFEALVRWQHPERGLVSPDQFIGIAEENGSMVAIGEWILREACRQLQAWRLMFEGAASLRMNVNVSAKQLMAPGFTCTMESALSACGLDADSVNMEITESVLMADADLARAVLNAIRQMGVHIHLDDFGTGYSSLAYLRDFPIDALKIDKSFVSGAGGPESENVLASIEIVRTVIALAQSLSLTVTAEGVETNGQREHLRTLGCTRAQGYYFSRPVDAVAAGAVIAAYGHTAYELV